MIKRVVKKEPLFTIHGLSYFLEETTGLLYMFLHMYVFLRFSSSEQLNCCCTKKNIKRPCGKVVKVEGLHDGYVASHPGPVLRFWGPRVRLKFGPLNIDDASPSQGRSFTQCTLTHNAGKKSNQSLNDKNYASCGKVEYNIHQEIDRSNRRCVCARWGPQKIETS
jgi:hypothetical protein